MTRDSFFLLLRFLHFCDNELVEENCLDVMYKIRPLFSDIVEKFKKYFRPFQKLVIDESLVLFRGKVGFRQYIKTKRHRFGLKLFVLCDCETGVILDHILYTGKNTDNIHKDQLGISGGVVKKMVEPYLRKGHIMYTDNWYTSPMLCQYLHENKIGSCGTVRESRKKMPKFPKKMEKGECVKKKCENILALKWKDKRPVTLLTTFHPGTLMDSGKVDRKTKEKIMKPDVVIDYTKNMRLVDKSDMQIGEIDSGRKTVKWYKKLFYHLLDISLLNSYNYYKLNTGKSVTLRKFSRDIVYEILEKYGKINLSRSCRASKLEGAPDRIQEQVYMSRHYLMNLPVTTEGKASKRKSGQKRCKVCNETVCKNKKRKVTSYMCAECQAPLCIGDCFRDYHSKVKY